ncbi:MAG: ABC transporter permease, partial [Chloroflexi bacterium]|nr:ABC transporter permease [Chloroflexota bacterium]
MAGYFARRFLYMIVTLIFISIIGFAIINLPAGTFMDAYMATLRLQGTSTSQAQMDAITQRFGLDKPLYVQYWKWITGFVRGDFGRSFQFQRPVKELIGARLAYTVLIAVATLVFVWVVAIPIGIYSATHQYSLGDHVFTFIGMAGVSVPGFMVALILMVVAQRYFGQSVGGLFSPEYINAPWSWGKLLDFLSHLWIPIVVVGAGGTAGLTRMMRGNLLDIVNMQYIQAARAR